MVEGDDLRRQERRVPKADSGDHRPEPDARGVARQGAEQGPRLEIGIVGHHEVVVDPGADEAELLRSTEVPGDLGVGRPAEGEDPEPHRSPLCATIDIATVTSAELRYYTTIAAWQGCTSRGVDGANSFREHTCQLAALEGFDRCSSMSAPTPSHPRAMPRASRSSDSTRTRGRSVPFRPSPVSPTHRFSLWTRGNGISTRSTNWTRAV